MYSTKASTSTISSMLEEKLQRRREWQITQELEKEHEKRKQMMIQDFERKRKLEIDRRLKSSQCSENSKRQKVEK